MTLIHILVFTVIALLAGWLIPRRWRLLFLLSASLLAIYGVQTSTPIRHLDFWLPTASIILTVFVWAITRHPEQENQRRTFLFAIVILSVVILVGLTRYAGMLCCLTPTRPPEIWKILLALGLAFLLSGIPYLLPKNRFMPGVAIVIILFLFIILKSQPLATFASAWLRSSAGQATELSSALDLPWLGFSFLAFRLIHTLRDFQMDRLPAYSLGEFVTYGLFYPTYTAGPIDGSQRFMGDLRQVNTPNEPDERQTQNITNTIQGGQRILWGIFKKFVLADSLALIALNSQNASQISSASWTWMLLYAYALRIYFDFAGYTDVAIGLGRLMDFKLPENFDHPYLKSNLTAFWNSWHITLAQWFRSYFFNPFTRFLRTRPHKLPTWLVILIGQFSTMVLIGLWHGITWNFFLWGAWHGLGLFIHNRWSTWARPRQQSLDARPHLKLALGLSGWLLTFNFVSLGWVWFAFPNLELAWAIFQKLFSFQIPFT